MSRHDSIAPPPSNLAPVCVRLPREGLLRLSPLELASRAVHEPGFFWLDSADRKGKEAGWSYLGFRPSRTIEWRDGICSISTEAGTRNLEGCGAFEILEAELEGFDVDARREAGRGSQAPAKRAPAPPFCGGWITVLGYDLGREIERLPRTAATDLPFPELYMSCYPVVLAFDHGSGNWWGSCLALQGSRGETAEACAVRMVENALKDICGNSAEAFFAKRDLPDVPCVVRSNFSRFAYEAAVGKALAYIGSGDIYQVNLSQRFEIPWTASGAALYGALRALSSPRYGALLNLGSGRWICSISPELFLSVGDGIVHTRPIKGTRPRGSTPEEDRRMAEALQTSLKDRAELTMIVDLERNDLGRVCEYGSVEVLSSGALEVFPSVFHRTATIAGRLRADRSTAHLLRAVFPGGSVTGAPKIRAMEIIEELEPTRRGPYCGGLGWIAVNGDLCLNLPIRTALLDQRSERVWYQAGGGIVADSDPALEYEESIVKAKAFFRAVNGSFDLAEKLGADASNTCGIPIEP